MNRGSNRELFYLADLDIVANKQDYYAINPTQRQITDFIKKLKGYALMEHEILILLDRFVFNKTFAEITDDHGFTDPRTTHKIYKMALAKAEKAITYFKEFKE